MAHFLISPRILLVKINSIFSALEKYIFPKENRPKFQMSNLPCQQDTRSGTAAVGSSSGALALKSQVYCAIQSWMCWDTLPWTSQVCSLHAGHSDYLCQDILTTEQQRNANHNSHCTNSLSLLGVHFNKIFFLLGNQNDDVK